MEFRRTLVAVLAGMAIFIAYQFFYSRFVPLPDPPPQTPLASPSSQTAAPSPVGPAAQSGPAAPRAAPGPALAFTAAESIEPVTIGGGPQDALKLELNPRGATLTRLWLTARENGRYDHRVEPGSDEPYEILSPVDYGEAIHRSFATHSIWIKEHGELERELGNLIWRTESVTPNQATFTTTLRAPDSGADLLRIVKSYALQPGQPLVELSLTIENLGAAPLHVKLAQDAASGVRREHVQYDMRRVMCGVRETGVVELSTAFDRGKLRKSSSAGESTTIVPPSTGKFVWTALTNKFFGVFMRPLPISEDKKDFVVSVGGWVAVPQREDNPGDLVARLQTGELEVAPNQPLRVRFEIYAGPKDGDVLEQVNAAFVDPSLIGYELARQADSRCCTFEPLPSIMGGLLRIVASVVRNEGIAIIILVLIVRTLMHPLTVFQQKKMYRTQEGMARVQPKLNALRERYANDKVKLNQEMMKLWADEGVNPAAPIIGMLPLFIQMPILVALWTALNTDIHLRHAPFDGYWITDLSAPDALFSFATPIDIPILSWLPLIGQMFRGVPSINVLPVLMGVSMWLQQKYMPKPQMQASVEAAGKQAPNKSKAKGRAAMTPEEQMRQQRMMAYMMSIMFPLMFYYMPSGLNLYWMATNVVGICESLIIRKQLKEEKERRDREGPPPPSNKKPGFAGRFLKRIASQAGDLQRQADKVSERPSAPRKRV